MNTRALLLAVVPAIAAGCGDDGDPAGGMLTAWKGATQHFELQGTLNGEMLNVKLDAAKVSCAREYEVPVVNGAADYGKGKLAEVKIKAEITIGAETRNAEIELKKHDFRKDAAGANVKIIARAADTSPAAGEMWFEWEWHKPADDSTIWESAAQSGSFVLGEFTGQPDQTGLVIPEGMGTIGGFLTAKWANLEEIRMSFTARCTKNDVVMTQ